MPGQTICSLPARYPEKPSWRNKGKPIVSFPQQTAGIGLRDGIRIVQRDLGMWVLLGLLDWLLTRAVDMVPLLDHLTTVVSLVLDIGVLIACGRAAQGEPLQLGELFAGFRAGRREVIVLAVVNWLAVCSCCLPPNKWPAGLARGICSIA